MKQIRYKKEEIWLQSLAMIPLESEIRRYFYAQKRTTITAEADGKNLLIVWGILGIIGFILRYPADKEEITGILYEPWHFRYVGKEAALFLWESNLTLRSFGRFWRVNEDL